jgi:hypothetical protein
MQIQIRPWMLTYTIIFGLLLVLFTSDDFTNQYPIIVTASNAICSSMLFVGDLLCSLNRVPLSLRTPWKIVFPILVFLWVFGGIYDSLHGKASQDASMSWSVLAWVIGFLLYLPTFIVHYLIGYGKQRVDDVA